MTPRELFVADPVAPQWIHGSDIGVDEDSGLWVRALADLRPDLSSRVCALKDRPISLRVREYAILTPDKRIAADPRHRSEPLWEHVHELRTGSIGTDWIAVY